MTFQDTNKQRVLRADQLDVISYDEYILSIFKSDLTKCFKYFQAGLLTRFDPELKAILRIIIWKYSVLLSDATLSQKMLDILYKTSKNNGILTTKRKAIFGLGLIGVAWLSERSYDLKHTLMNFGFNVNKIWKMINFLTIVHKILELVNFIVFLRDARYRSVWDRILGIYSVFSRKQAPRVVYFEYMNEDILRSGLAELLFCVLPMVNIPRLRNILLRLMWKKSSAINDGKTVSNFECGICGDLPTNVHQTDCGHIFCYTCIKANLMADPSFFCPLCGEAIHDVEPASA
ncbi:peroxisome biogenesis factor 2-like [Xenia sp. Carnegie-2017]|uniref:peroxisome biogenesis factor 2-like n=1 Tax=Xenia sp. Carnegie-2017 TaxID=2897299 RepID=UPI001F044F2D|nr:peroxisome biogenesis factor 2-like [Xenia sp. Carnegie-2017]